MAKRTIVYPYIGHIVRITMLYLISCMVFLVTSEKLLEKRSNVPFVVDKDCKLETLCI